MKNTLSTKLLLPVFSQTTSIFFQMYYQSVFLKYWLLEKFGKVHLKISFEQRRELWDWKEDEESSAIHCGLEQGTGFRHLHAYWFPALVPRPWGKEWSNKKQLLLLGNSPLIWGLKEPHVNTSTDFPTILPSDATILIYVFPPLYPAPSFE